MHFVADLSLQDLPFAPEIAAASRHGDATERFDGGRARLRGRRPRLQSCKFYPNRLRIARRTRSIKARRPYWLEDCLVGGIP